MEASERGSRSGRTIAESVVGGSRERGGNLGRDPGGLTFGEAAEREEGVVCAAVSGRRLCGALTLDLIRVMVGMVWRRTQHGRRRRK